MYVYDRGILSKMEGPINKDLVLREYLALERTKLANETTLLAYIRTGLYFLVAGSTLGQVVDTYFWEIAGPVLIGCAFVIIAIGFAKYLRIKKRIASSGKNIGNSSEAFIKAVTGKEGSSEF